MFCVRACPYASCRVFLLFYVLGAATGKYLVPILNSISDALRLSQNVAGVTFLALANGAPDVFTSIAAFTVGSFARRLASLLLRDCPCPLTKPAHARVVVCAIRATEMTIWVWVRCWALVRCSSALNPLPLEPSSLCLCCLVLISGMFLTAFVLGWIPNVEPFTAHRRP